MSRTIDTPLSRLRRAKDLTQQELAKLASTDHKYISRIEAGLIQPGFNMILRISGALDVDPVYYFELIYTTYLESQSWDELPTVGKLLVRRTGPRPKRRLAAMTSNSEDGES